MFGRKKKQKRRVPEGCQVVQFEGKKEKASASFWSRILFFVMAALFITSCFWILIISPYMQVNAVSLEGEKSLAKSEIILFAESLYEGKMLGFLPKNNLLLFPEHKIERLLKQNFRKISSVDVERIFPNKVRIKIEERDSLLVWCSGGPCYIIDENGFAYTGADFESPEIKQNNLIVVINTGAKPVSLGEQVLKVEYIDFIIGANQRLSSEHNFAMSGECHAPSALAEEVSCKTTDGVDISLSMNLPLETTMKTLVLFMKKEIDDNEKANLEYLDLRFENRVFYKLKGEQPQDGENGESMVAGEETSKDKNEDNDASSKKKKKKR